MTGEKRVVQGKFMRALYPTLLAALLLNVACANKNPSEDAAEEKKSSVTAFLSDSGFLSCSPEPFSAEFLFWQSQSALIDIGATPKLEDTHLKVILPSHFSDPDMLESVKKALAIYSEPGSADKYFWVSGIEKTFRAVEEKPEYRRQSVNLAVNVSSYDMKFSQISFYGVKDFETESEYAGYAFKIEGDVETVRQKLEKAGVNSHNHELHEIDDKHTEVSCVMIG